jgi:lactobin A/cerein 7B family class IIb bacteriocin
MNELNNTQLQEVNGGLIAIGTIVAGLALLDFGIGVYQGFSK